jgi:hypothetical protein
MKQNSKVREAARAERRAAKLRAKAAKRLAKQARALPQADSSPKPRPTR